jgi:hypothetical protein
MSRALALLAVAAVALGAGACSHHSAPTVNPDTAAQTLAATYKLDPQQQACLVTGFRHDAAATRPLASDGPATDDELAALGQVADACIPVSVLATAIVGGAGQGGSSLPAAQQACLRQAVGRLDATDRSTLLAGLAVPTALGDLQTALMGRITDGLLNTCHISIPGVTQQGTTPTTASSPTTATTG